MRPLQRCPVRCRLMPLSNRAAFKADGFVVFEHSDVVARWAAAAKVTADQIKDDPEMQRQWLRHDQTWFVGVDALPNLADGSIKGAPLSGPWDELVEPPKTWHPAQLSIVYPGYPGRDPDESEAAHRFRIKRCAAHVDGLLPEGPNRRRFLREPHAFIMGLPLDHAQASPLVVWPGSHHVMGAAFREAVGVQDIGDVDLTDIYQAARRSVFETIDPVDVLAAPGQAILLHRHMVHGVRPWDPHSSESERKVAYFRPRFDDLADWLANES